MKTISGLKALFMEMTRFVLVGGISFVIDFGLLFVFQEFVFKTLYCGVLVSQALSFSISLIIHYFLATFWVFRAHSVKSAAAHARASSLFIVTNVVGLSLNELALFIGSSLLGFHYLFVKLVAAALVMVWNYLCQKLFIYTPSPPRAANLFFGGRN